MMGPLIDKGAVEDMQKAGAGIAGLALAERPDIADKP